MREAAEARKAMGNSRGMAFVSVLILMVFLVPIVSVFMKRAITQSDLNTKERQIKTARALSNNVLVDFMRQFSQDHYDGHYDAAALARAEVFYDVGYSTVTVQADPDNHTLFIRALGKYGSNSANPNSIKRLAGLIQFVSDLTRFGTMINGPFGISAGNVTYTGGLWFNGALNITGGNVTFNGGPVISNGNHTGVGSTVRNCDVYYQGTASGGTFNGARYNFVPPVQWPTINTAYYSLHYNHMTASDQTWQFNVVGGSGTFSVVSSTVVVTIPPTGAILFAQNCNLTLRGTVQGRVTIVCSGTAGSPSQGNVTIDDNFVYANGTNSASARDSIAVMATNRITFSRTGADLTVNGIYFVEQGTLNISLSGSAGRVFNLNGVRCSGISINPGNSFSGGRNLTYDPNLALYPPPGLPEKPVLVMWQLEG
ncbi:MAG: hypothetical protein HY548_02445 [Elusimicrobia bacterium]|nr:hypothetical protein [Elusimicrobiota bacterium]